MKGKFIKKLTACALAAAMVITTPVTASAAEFKDFFWISHGDAEEDEANHGSNPTGTGTVSTTNTNTGVLQNSELVTGIVIKENGEAKSSTVIDFAKTNTTNLVAEVQYADGKDISQAEKDQMNKKISWSSSNLEIIRPSSSYAARQNCKVTAYKGGFASMTASIDVDNDGSADYYARIMIMAKKAVTELHLNTPDKLYAGHTYNLMDYVTFGDREEYDEVAFTVKVSNDKKAKLVTLTKDGTLKLDKKIKDKDGLTAEITATSANGKSDTKTVALSEGTPITGLKFEGSYKKPTYDIADNYAQVNGEWRKTTTKTSPLKVTVATKAKKAATMADTTDDITWSTSDSRIVRVISSESDDSVYFVGESVGKATITATATSGKNAKVNVVVSAKLLDITSVSIDGNLTYSGKTTPLVIKRVPAQNTDKLKITVNNKDEKKVVKVKAGITPTITPVADITTKLAYDGKQITSVKIEPANKKTTSVGSKDVTEFTVKQSDVEISGIKGVLNGKVDELNKKTVPMNSNRVANYTATIKNAVMPSDPTEALSTVSWVSSKETVATVSGGRVNVVGDGSAKITVSSVYKDTKGKYKTAKYAFTIKSTPKCEAIELKANIVTVKAGKDAVISVKQQLPKKAADNVTWYIYNKSNGELVPVTKDGKKTNDKKCTIPAASVTDGMTVIAMAGSAEVEAKIIVAAK